MSATIYVGSASVAASLPLAWWAVTGDRGVRKRTRQRVGPQQDTDLRELMLRRSAGERVLRPSLAGIYRKLRRATPVGFVEALERRINLAGVSQKFPVERILGAKLLLGLIGLALGLFAMADGVTTGTMFVGILFPVMGFVLPDTFITRMAKERQESIEIELPDAMDQITITVEAGLGLEAAIARVATYSDTALAEEMAHMLQDIKLGLPRDEALDRLLQRTDVPDLRQFVHSLRQAERNGIPLANVLRTHAEELREKRRQRAEEKAHALPVKLIFPLLLCILPALFVVIMGPSILQFADSALFAGG